MCADRFFVGWIFRLFARPRTLVTILERASTAGMILRYGKEMPELKITN